MSGQLNFYSCDLQLRNSIKLNLTKSFMNEDFYLVKWLKGKNETCKMKNLLWNTKYFNLFPSDSSWNVEDATEILIKVH